jgi:hypothetical protein
MPKRPLISYHNGFWAVIIFHQYLDLSVSFKMFKEHDLGTLFYPSLSLKSGRFQCDCLDDDADRYAGNHFAIICEEIA